MNLDWDHQRSKYNFPKDFQGISMLRRCFSGKSTLHSQEVFALPVLRYDLSVAVCDLSAGWETVAFKVSL